MQVLSGPNPGRMTCSAGLVRWWACSGGGGGERTDSGADRLESSRVEACRVVSWREP